MTEHVIACYIKVGKEAKEPIARMMRVGNDHGSVNTRPEWFKCHDCKIKWSARYAQIDLRTISCSNCYSDNIRLLRLRINVPEPHELNPGGQDVAG